MAQTGVQGQCPPPRGRLPEPRKACMIGIRTAVNYLLAEDRAVAAGRIRATLSQPGRKVPTPQGSVPDNVRDVGFKTRDGQCHRKRYRLGYPSPLLRKRPEGPLEPQYRVAGLPGTLAVAETPAPG